MGELLGAFAYASDLAFGLNLEDSLRTCYLATRLAEHLGVSEEDRRTVYYASLLKDAGCTSWTSELARIWQSDEIAARRELILFTDRSTYAGLEAWMHQYVAVDLPPADRQTRFHEVMAELPQIISEAITNTALVAGRIAKRLGMPSSVQLAMRHLFEQWDGSGAPEALKGATIPIGSRIVLPAFVMVPIYRLHGRDSAVAAVRQGSGSTFDPEVVEAVGQLARDDAVWAGLEGEHIRERVLGMEPASEIADVAEEKVDDIALAFADFIDLKSRFAAAHSRRVAGVAEQLARLHGCAPEAVVQIRRAALMHDLGLVAIPSFSLEKSEGELSEGERERYRLHPYHGERILQRVAALSPYAEMVGNHQERVDGTGYYRGLRGNNISLGARIIAVADRLDELTHDAPGRLAMQLTEALDTLDREPGLDSGIVESLRRALGAEVNLPLQRWPAGLTRREVDVLRLAARGMTRAQIGTALGISENTVRHHLEHIYDKTGTSTRVEATLFAIENGLLT
jgi:response regulator RpfG family c-di-GMP phosphodiesterase/DNA-binding CsgD family transcriptional regulator